MRPSEDAIGEARSRGERVQSGEPRGSATQRSPDSESAPPKTPETKFIGAKAFKAGAHSKKKRSFSGLIPSDLR